MLDDTRETGKRLHRLLREALALPAGHGPATTRLIEHKQMGCVFRLVVIDDHLNALFVHASLPPLHPQEKTAASFALRSARRFSRLIKAVTPRSTPFDDEDGITQYTP